MPRSSWPSSTGSPGNQRCGTRPNGCCSTRPPRSTRVSCARPVTTCSRCSIPTGLGGRRRPRWTGSSGRRTWAGSCRSARTASAASGSAAAGPWRTPRSSRPPCTPCLHPCLGRTRTAARPHATSETTAPAPGTRWCRPASKPARPTACSRSSTAPNPGSPSPSRWTSSARGSVPRPSTPATSSPSPPFAGWRVTPTSSPPSSARWVKSSTSAAPRGSSPPRSGKPSSYATSTAASPAAADNHWPAMPTTFSTGPTAAPRRWTTWCCSAAPTTPWSTRLPGRSGSTRSTADPSSGHRSGLDKLDHPNIKLDHPTDKLDHPTDKLDLPTPSSTKRGGSPRRVDPGDPVSGVVAPPRLSAWTGDDVGQAHPDRQRPERHRRETAALVIDRRAEDVALGRAHDHVGTASGWPPGRGRGCR